MSASTSSQPHKKVAVMPTESELIAFDNAAAGHEGISSNASGSLIIKPCTQAEITFYESAKDHPLFQAHMPTYIGSLNQHEDQEAVSSLLSAQDGTAATTQVTDTDVADPSPTPSKSATWKPSGGKKISTGTAIVLENIVYGFKQPNILDVKLGARLWDDDAPEPKRRKLDEVSQRTTSGSLGFRIAGMKVFARVEAEVGEDEKEFVKIKAGKKEYNKFYGQSLNEENVADAFTTYFGGVGAGETNKLKHKRAKFLIERFIRELESLQYVVEKEESRMYSASVLLVYEGDEETLEENIDNEKNEEQQQADDNDDDEEASEDGDKIRKVHEMRMIDFAHAKWVPGEGPDENVLRGLRSVIEIMRNLVSS